MEKEFKYKDITDKILGAAIEVHKKLGNGFQELIYQRALAIELEKRNLIFIREKEMEIEYDGIHIGSRRVDFFVENKIMVELKALSKLEEVHLAQAINYLEAYNLEVGLLINFGASRIEIKRLLNRKYIATV